MIHHSTILTCPICQNALSHNDKSFKCANGHCFDLSKEGYVNLLPVNRKNSMDPGDNKEMIQSRRHFLDKGYYWPLVNNIAGMIREHLKHDQATLLDCGCGEGYYTKQLFDDEKLSLKEAYGFDISKHSIRMAAHRYKHLNFFVSSIQQIPIEPSTIDFALVVFAPLNLKELDKVLKEIGHLLIVYAGTDHLKELASMIYTEVKPHQYDPLKKVQSLFSLAAKQSLTFNIKLDNTEDILALLKMTPYYWSTSKEKLIDIENQKTIDLTCDFELAVFEKKKS